MATDTVCIHVARGHGDLALAELMIRETDRLFEGKRDSVLFFDGLEFTGYESQFRARLAESARRSVDSGQLKLANLLTRSKIVAMGAAVVNLAIGSRIQVFSDIAAYERVIVKAGASSALRGKAEGD
jgi:hypothetical protein